MVCDTAKALVSNAWVFRFPSVLYCKLRASDFQASKQGDAVMLHGARVGQLPPIIFLNLVLFLILI